MVRPDLLPAFADADEAYQAELAATYGKQAADARYDERGEATDTLRALSAARLSAGRACGLLIN